MSPGQATRHRQWAGARRVADKPITRAGNEHGGQAVSGSPWTIVEPFVFTLSVLAVLIPAVR